MNKYLTKDLDKALALLHKMSQVYVALEIDPLGRLLLKASDIANNTIVITIFDESSAKFPEINRTEPL